MDERSNFVNYGATQTLPINFYSEDFIAGFTGVGSRQIISVARRFFCLFVTFDLVFNGLLWVICVVISGENVYKALAEQVLHYNFETSLFDVVIAAAVRFLLLIFFYGLLKVNHWFIVALTTTLSCAFLIVKVFYYVWPLAQQPVFQVLLIICSFIISWFEAWFLDSRVIPQEQYSRTLTDLLNSSVDSRTPLLPHFLSSLSRGSVLQPPESYRNFYSPVESDDEDEEFKNLGTETVQKAYELLESTNWKVEKVTAANDIISTQTRVIGKVYKLTAKVNYSPKKLLQELFYNIEEVPSWNPTLLESKIIRKIDGCTDISYSISASGGGGLVKSRDFVNLRCWKLFRNSRIVENYNINTSLSKISVKTHSSDGDNEDSESDEAEGNDGVRVKKGTMKMVNEKPLKKSASENVINENNHESVNDSSAMQLSKSLGAREVNCTSEDDEPYADAQTEIAVNDGLNTGSSPEKCVFVSAAMSIEYPLFPPTAKYIRGDNLISCWAMRSVPDDADSCVFEWLLCIDLKGSLPKYVLNTAFVSLMTDYMIYLRGRVQQLNEENSRCA